MLLADHCLALNADWCLAIIKTNKIYPNNADKGLEPMKQMQPHVMVRPNKNPIKTRLKNPNKRKFVTIKDINHEKEQMLMTARKKLEYKNTIAGPIKEPGGSLKAAVMNDQKEEGKSLMGVIEFAGLFSTNNDSVEGSGEVGGTEQVNKGTEEVNKGG
ncbi:hypothetical protein OROHE_009754 [Orobanche hederae]